MPSENVTRVIPWAMVLAIALPIVDVVAYWSLGFLVDGAGLDVWIIVHRPAFAIAGVVVPPLPYAHAPAPVPSFTAVMALCLAQAALIGALLGWIMEFARKYGRKHAL